MSETEPEQQTIEHFISEYGLTMTSEPVPENPNMGDMITGSRHFYCTIVWPEVSRFTAPARRMSTYYSVGPGIVDHWLKDNAPKFQGNPRLSTSMAREEYVKKYGKKYKPKLPDLLDCLASDCSGANEPFEGWVANYGYDEDSRKAENTYHIVQRQSRELRQLLGAEAYEFLIYQIERL